MSGGRSSGTDSIGLAESAKPEEPPRIVELPRAVADAIAAGEVIERPASAVKELLENSCDAGATRIEVEIEGAGLERIVVRDDGMGMSATELPLAFRRHATSKLRSLDDLEALHSYGFRGEALPSVAAVATVDCVSRPLGAALGARLLLPGPDGHAAVESVGAPAGTTIELRDLFARQPARRRFLPGPRSERAAIARVCADLALARPAIALRLRVEGNEVLNTPGDAAAGEDALELRRPPFAAIWGGDPAASAIAFRDERTLDEGGVARVEGLAASALHHRGRRDGLRLFVNSRPIASRALQRAAEEAYAELLPGGRFPIAAIFLTLPPDRIDANVHPAKATVKLADERAVFALLQRSLREALLAGSGQADPAAGAERRAGAEARSLPLPALPPEPPDFLRRDPEDARRDRVAPATDAAGERGERLDQLRRAGAAPPAAIQPAIDAPGAAVRGVLAMPLLRLLGQLRATFIVAEGPEGMLLVDQHAAHERVLYERLLSARAVAAPEQQALLDPPVIELGAEQAAALGGYEQGLEALGFRLEPFGERALRLRALPACLAPAAEAGGRGRVASAALEAILDDLAGTPREAAHHDPVAASAACHGSVRAGMTLSQAEMAALLRDLEACDNPHTCPHGRPTSVDFPAVDLERQFGRR